MLLVLKSRFGNRHSTPPEQSPENSLTTLMTQNVCFQLYLREASEGPCCTCSFVVIKVMLCKIHSLSFIFFSYIISNTKERFEPINFSSTKQKLTHSSEWARFLSHHYVHNYKTKVCIQIFRKRRFIL